MVFVGLSMGRFTSSNWRNEKWFLQQVIFGFKSKVVQWNHLADRSSYTAFTARPKMAGPQERLCTHMAAGLGILTRSQLTLSTDSTIIDLIAWTSHGCVNPKVQKSQIRIDLVPYLRQNLNSKATTLITCLGKNSSFLKNITKFRTSTT